MARGEEITDDQWTVLATLILEPPRREDGRGRSINAGRSTFLIHHATVACYITITIFRDPIAVSDLITHVPIPELSTDLS